MSAVCRREQNRHTALTPVHIIVIGHVDSGKSTITDHLVGFGPYGLMCQRDKLGLLKACRERDAKMDGWIFDTPLDLHRFQMTVVDVPGHINFMRNMITGTSQVLF